VRLWLSRMVGRKTDGIGGDSLQARGGDRDVVVEVEPAAGFSPVVQRALEQGSQRIDTTGRR
jgi:hypothetical protein